MANNTGLIREIEEAHSMVMEMVYRHPVDARNFESLLSTLQRARDAIVKTQDELRLLSEAQDIMGRPQTAKQLMDIHNILSAYTPEER